MHDKKISTRVEFLQRKGELMVVQDFVITDLPDKVKTAEDVLFNILRKVKKKYGLSEGNLFSFHQETNEKGEDVFFYSLMMPINKALFLRRKERAKLFINNPDQVSKEEVELFSALQEEAQKKGEALEVCLNRSIYFDLEDPDKNSPINMPGLPDEEDR